MATCVPLSSSTTATTAPIKCKQQYDWTTLPHSILHAIFAHVRSSSPASLSSLALACKQFATLARTSLFASVTLKSSSNTKDISRLEQLDHLLIANPCLAESLESLRLELDDGHRWIFSRILTPPFRTEDPASYDELRGKRVGLDKILSRILLRISGSPRSPTIPAYTRCLRVFELSHYTFYPISRDIEVMRGWQSVLATSTLEVVRMSDVLDLPLALLGFAGKGVKEMGLLRVKLDRRDTEQAWSQERMDYTNWPIDEEKDKRLSPRVLSIRDCYPETVDPVIACAMNPSSFLDFSEVEELTVHPCLAVQAPSYNKLVNSVIALSGVLDRLTWMSSAQHQVNDLDALCAADFTRFKEVELVFDDGNSGFPQLLADIRDLLRAASNVFRTAPPSPDPAEPFKDHHPRYQFAVDELLSVEPVNKSKRRITSCLEKLNLRFDLENLAMQSRPESTMSCPDPTVVMHYHEKDKEHDQCPRANMGSSESVYYAHIKYIWRLDELDMEALRDIDSMLCGVASDDHEELGHAKIHAFPHFKRISTTCTFNPSSSYLLDEEKARDVFDACKEFVQRGLPKLHQKNILSFAFQKA